MAWSVPECVSERQRASSAPIFCWPAGPPATPKTTLGRTSSDEGSHLPRASSPPRRVASGAVWWQQVVVGGGVARGATKGGGVRGGRVGEFPREGEARPAPGQAVFTNTVSVEPVSSTAPCAPGTPPGCARRRRLRRHGLRPRAGPGLPAGLDLLEQGQQGPQPAAGRPGPPPWRPRAAAGAGRWGA